MKVDFKRIDLLRTAIRVELCVSIYCACVVLALMLVQTDSFLLRRIVGPFLILAWPISVFLLSWIAPVSVGVAYWKRKEIGSTALYQALLSCMLTYTSFAAFAYFMHRLKDEM